MVTRLVVSILLCCCAVLPQAPPPPILEFGIFEEESWTWTTDPPQSTSIEYLRMRVHAPVGTWIGLVGHASPDGTLGGNDEKAAAIRNANPFCRPVTTTGAVAGPHLVSLVASASIASLQASSSSILLNPQILRREILGHAGDGLSTSTDERADSVKAYGMEVCSGAPPSGPGYPPGYHVVEWCANAANWITYTRLVSSAPSPGVSTSELWAQRLSSINHGLEDSVFATSAWARDLLREQGSLAYPGNLAYADSVYFAAAPYGFRVSVHAIAIGIDPAPGPILEPPRLRPPAANPGATNGGTRGTDGQRPGPYRLPGFSMSEPNTILVLGLPPIVGENCVMVPILPGLPEAFHGVQGEPMCFSSIHALQVDCVLFPDMIGGFLVEPVLDRGLFPGLLAHEFGVTVPFGAAPLGLAYCWSFETNAVVWPFLEGSDMDPVPHAGLLFYDGTPF